MRTVHALTGAVLVPLAAMMMSSATALAQRDNSSLQTVQAVGEATISADPDQVQIDIGVMTESESAATAASQNAEKVAKVLAALRKEMGTDASIKTISYSLNPGYRPPLPDGREQSQIYQAHNIVRVETGRLDKVGRIADVAVSAGANIIQSVTFALKNQGEARARALRQATEMARSKVETITSALSMRVLRIISAEEGAANGPIPMYYGNQMKMDMGGGAATNIEPGSVDIRAVVTITAEVAAK